MHGKNCFMLRQPDNVKVTTPSKEPYNPELLKMLCLNLVVPYVAGIYVPSIGMDTFAHGCVEEHVLTTR